ncbi:methionine--tRNA ligase [Salinibacter ruber]|uniref:methionine--tRNA ligase n=1 Tax=Salinibacter ruber TaxID=146919 RepID=UPI000E575E50|nr:methionine--tRNA ligase [Salinibacter ruber]
MADPTSSERLLVTAALPYANGPIHIGHLAGAYLPADLFVRYQRLKGEDVAFICGSDEMGVAILMRAIREDRTPEDIIDTYHPQIRDNFERFGMSFDYYGRTSSETHTETTQDFFRVLDENGGFDLKTDEQLYDPEAEMFLADRFVIGTCPVCGFEEAYGDQCEQCGSSLSPTELENPQSTLTDATPEFKETTHWYLPLGELQPQLEEWIGSHPEWKNNVVGQIQSWFDEGLKGRAITRDVPWGVPVPDDVAERHGLEAEGKVIYVWFDAPIGYISATKEWAAEQGEPDAWTDYWQDEDTRLVHFIGKDNIVFHCLMFPSMLMEHGDYVLPDNVPANEFLNLEGEKLSTSRGWAVWLHEYLDDFAGERHAPDLLRYALATTLPETKDADFSWEGFQQRVNGELANVFGNFVHRTLTFAQRYFDGTVPPLEDPSEADRAMLDRMAEVPDTVGAAYEEHRTRDAVFETMALARRGNKYFNDTEPWHTHESDPQACANTIHVSLQVCAALSILFEPVLPSAAATLRERIGLENVRTSTPDDDPADAVGWEDAGAPLLPAGHPIPSGPDPEPLFQKIDDDTIEAQIEKLRDRAAERDTDPSSTTDMDYEALSDNISFDDFTQLDLRAGTVTTAEPVPDADKLLRLEVDLGFEERQILAGVAEQMAPDDVVGLEVVVVANMAPKEMFGFESQGMVLMAEEPDGTFVPVTTEAEDGSVVR